MKILQINQSDIAGGAAIAGYRLHEGLKKYGVESKILAGSIKTNSDDVNEIPYRNLSVKLLRNVTRELGLNFIEYTNTFDILKHPFYKDADILNFHNLHTSRFSYLAIPKLTGNKPAVFTLHDMWSFTGHCAYSYDCTRWQNGCGKCPYPERYPKIKRDNTGLEWKLKNRVYNRSNLTIVAPSHWLAESAKKSMLGQFPVHHIPYGIDTEAYQPVNREQCRKTLGISGFKYVLIFGAESLKDPRKGGDLLLKSLSKLPESLKKETLLLTMGRGGKDTGKHTGIEQMNLGYIGGSRLKAVAYSAADLLLFPTRADNLPLVIMESLACGTPVVSFQTGGVPDMVRPGETGYLARPEDTSDFCNGVIELLEDDGSRGNMEKTCRRVVLNEYRLELQTQRYLKLYRGILNLEVLAYKDITSQK